MTITIGFIAHNVASEREVDQVIEEAISAGATLVMAPKKVFGGGYSASFKDPGGYLWEVAHNPHFWATPTDEEPQ